MKYSQKIHIIECLAADQGLWKQIVRKVGNLDLAEEILQKTLLKVYQNLDKLRDESRLRPWVFQIMKNEVYKTFRENENWNTYQSIPPQMASKREKKDDELHTLLFRTLHIKKFYTKMEHKAAKILLENTTGDNKSTAQIICRQLCCEMNYVTSLLYRIRRKIDNYLQECGYDSYLKQKQNVH